MVADRFMTNVSKCSPRWTYERSHKHDIKAAYETFTRLLSAENSLKPAFSPASANAAISNISGQLKSEKPSKNDSKKTVNEYKNPNTKKYVEKKQKETGKSAYKPATAKNPKTRERRWWYSSCLRYDTIGDHPILGEVIYDPNTFSVNLVI